MRWYWLAKDDISMHFCAMRSIQNCILITFAALSLGACSTLDLRNAYKLSKTDIADVEPEHARVAIIYPKDVSMDGISLSFKLSQADTTLLDEKFNILVKPDEVAGVKIPKGDGLSPVFVYGLDDGDIARAKDFQRKVALEQASHKNEPKGSPKRTMDFGFFFKPTADTPAAVRYCDDDVKKPFYVWVKTDSQTPYSRIVRTKSIEKLVKGITPIICKSAQDLASAEKTAPATP